MHTRAATAVKNNRNKFIQQQQPFQQAGKNSERSKALNAGAASGVDGLFQDWVRLQREACEAQIAMVRDLFDAQQQRFEDLIAVRPSAPLPGTDESDIDPGLMHEHPKPIAPSSFVEAINGPPLITDEDHLPPGTDGEQPQGQSTLGASPNVVNTVQRVDSTAPADEEALACLGRDEGTLDYWKRSSGMHTVEKWATNYNKHPAGWGALLMIHGVGEVSGRLRSKVENFAIYSALFLSVSLPLLVEVPDGLTDCSDSDWACEILGRVYSFGIVIGIAAHMLSILLAMGFVNVLNEAARDSDVIRMFSRGAGFVATVKCQKAFIVGCCATFVGITAGSMIHFMWEILAVALISAALILNVYRTTVRKLAKSASILGYWREEKGGNPDPDDPYDLSVPLACLQRRGAAAKPRQCAAPGAAGRTAEDAPDAPAEADAQTRGELAVEAGPRNDASDLVKVYA